MLPAISFIFSRAACDDAVQQCLAAGLRLTTATEHQQFGWDLGFSPKLALPLANLAEAAGGYRLPINSKRINLQPILLPERQERLDREIAEPRLTPVAKRFQH